MGLESLARMQECNCLRTGDPKRPHLLGRMERIQFLSLLPLAEKGSNALWGLGHWCWGWRE